MALLLLFFSISSLHAQSIFDPNAPAPPPGTVELPGVMGDDGVRTLTGNVVVDKEALNSMDMKPTTKIIYTPQLRATMKELGITEERLKEMLDQQRRTGKPTNVTVGSDMFTWDFSQIKESQIEDVRSALGTSSSSSPSSSSSSGSTDGSSSSLLQSSASGGLAALLNSHSPDDESKSVIGGGISRDTSLIDRTSITRDSSLVGGTGLPIGSGLIGGTGTSGDSSLQGARSIVREAGLIGGTGPITDSATLRDAGILRESDLIGGTGPIRDAGLIGGTGDAGLIDTTGIVRDTGILRGASTSQDNRLTRGDTLTRDPSLVRETDIIRDSRLIGRVDPNFGVGVSSDSDIRRDPGLTTGGGLMQLVRDSGGLPSGSVSAGSGVVRPDGIGTVSPGIGTLPDADSRIPSGRGENFVLDELHKQIQDLIAKVNKMHKDLFEKTLKLTDQEYAEEEAKIANEERRLAELLRREKELTAMQGISDPMGRPRDQADVAAMEAARQRDSLNRQIEEIQRNNENILRSLNAEAANRARNIEGFPTDILDQRPLGTINPDRPLPGGSRDPPLDPQPLGPINPDLQPAPFDPRSVGPINLDGPLDPRQDERLSVTDTSPSARRVMNREIVRDNRAGPPISDARIGQGIPSDEIRRLEMERDALRRDYDRLQALLERRRRVNGPLQNFPRMDERRRQIPSIDQRRPPVLPMDPRRPDRNMGPFGPTPRMYRDRYTPMMFDHFGQRGYPQYEPYFMYRGNMMPMRRPRPSTTIRSRGTNAQTISNQLPNRASEIMTSSTSDSPFSLGADVIVTEAKNSGMFDNAIPRPFPTYYVDPSDQSIPRSSGFSSFSSGMVTPGMGPYLPRSSVASSSSRFVRRTDSNPMFLRGASTINYIPGQTRRNRRISF
ncbi:hypothetical protein FSP39_000470 [Pinctada imbricata]|uniref:Uncharacterized protein n=1 Tax=Pinctada imbricata TaxID=66713 RepID=A0AA88YLU9_PINIB|nr:hypothetical protein FSP39_000470 [Pinctada imbricata]